MAEHSGGRNQDIESSETSSTPAPLLIAKFGIERGAEGALARERLFDRLDRAVRRPFTLVTGPAGAGKTTLVSSWAAGSAGAGPAARALTWVTLDEGDQQPGLFWSYVLEGLTRSGVPVSATAPQRPYEVDQSFLVRLSADLYGREQPVVLVLDDAEVLVGTAVLDQLDFLLRHAGPRLGVVLVSRVHPGAVLHRHGLAGSLTEIGPGDLAFTEPEARALLRSRGVTLPDTAMSSLMERTRGWAAGLVLAAMSVRDHRGPDPAVAALTGDSGELADYFLAEVVDHQPPGIRRFLCRTSIVDHLRPALADELSGGRGAARTLSSLARANTFLETCAEHDACYRYHPLFAELLRRQLGDERSRTVVRLHRTASAWFAAAGMITDSVRHAAAAGDWAPAAGLTVQSFAFAQLLDGPDAAGFEALFAGMPQRVDGTDAAVVLAALALGRSDLTSCTEHLARARQAAATRPAGPTTALAIALVELLLARVRGDMEEALDAALVLESAVLGLTAEGVDVPPLTRGLVLLHTGAARCAAGDLEAAAAILADAVRVTRADGCEVLHLTCLGQLALVDALAGRLVKADELGRTAGTWADEHGVPLADRAPAGELALAWVNVEWGTPTVALLHAERAATSSAIRTDPGSAALVSLVRSTLLRTAGDLTGARSALTAAGASDGDGAVPGWVQRRLAVAATALDIMAGRPDQASSSTGDRTPWERIELARAQLSRGESPASGSAVAELGRLPDLPLGERVDAWLVQACCALDRGDSRRARTALDRALRLAEPERMRRPFLQAPPRLRSFMRHNDDLTHHAWLGVASHRGAPSAPKVPRARTSADHTNSPVIVEVLTAKEHEVLGHLAALLSTEEIASTMFVSVNTVKTHVRGILRKLAASRRNEAIRRARELDLL